MRWIDVTTFAIVAVIIWGLGTLRAYRGRQPRRGGGAAAFHPLGFIIGKDNRLSLSRLQAFAWTMVIFGTLAAAWRSHGTVQPATPDAIQKIQAIAKQTRERAIDAHATAIQASISGQLLADAASAARQDSAELLPGIVDTLANRALLDSVNKSLAARRKEFFDSRTGAVAAERLAKIESLKANALEAEAARYVWILIPAGLLALAGISIGSGVASSLITAVNDKGVQPCVTSVAVESYDALLPRYPRVGERHAVSIPYFVVRGSNLGHDGRIRFDGEYAEVMYWSDDGTIAVVAAPATLAKGTGIWSGTLIVDSPNGKIAYGTRKATETTFDRAHSEVILGSATDALEWSDLFRDDSSPSNLDLMKFQMFGWTLISISLYLWNFFTAIATQHVLASLPVIDESLVILMGVSQAGYLTSKGVQNVSKPPGSVDERYPAVAQRNPDAGNSGSANVPHQEGLIPPDPSSGEKP